MGIVQPNRSDWAQTLPGAKLESFFASQRYAGGYLARRRRAYGKERYHPFLVTEAGSIFRLSGVTGDRLALVAELCSRGLPAATVGGQEATWENCPYLRENGYGHISANHLGGGTKLVEAVTHG